MKKLITILLSVMLPSVAALAASVWKVTKDGSEVYIGGTVHLLRKVDLPLPVEYDDAYADSSVLVFETDLSKSESPEIQQLMIQMCMAEEGKTLSDYLSPEVFSELEQAFAKQATPIGGFIGFKPALPVLVLSMGALNKIGVSEEGIDKIYYKKGIGDEKSIQYLEEIEFQIKLLSEMGAGYEDDFVRYSLADLDEVADGFLDLLTAWREGDVEYLEHEMVDIMKTEFPILYDDILVKRNNNWMPKIEAMFVSQEKEFVMVGLAHLVGEDGVLEQLARKGYLVEAL